MTSLIRWAEIGDLHLSENDAFGKYSKELRLNTRTHNKITKLHEIIDSLLTQNLDFIYFAGDIYDSINPTDILRKLFNEVIKKIMQANIGVFIIPGNHETTGQVTAFDGDCELIAGANWKQYFAMSVPCSLTLKDHKFVMIPWGKSDYLHKIDNKDKKDIVLFGHMTVEDADLGTRKIKNLGNVVKIKEMNKFRRVALGHIHLPQSYYIGSLFRNNFGERDYVVGYNICEWDDDISTRFIHTNDLIVRQFNITENVLNDDKNIFDAVEENSITKVVFKGSRVWLKSLNFKNLRENILKRNPFALKFERSVEDIADNVQVDSVDGKVPTFAEVISKLTTDNELVKYVVRTVEAQ